MVVSLGPYTPALALMVVAVLVAAAVAVASWRRRPDPGTEGLAALMGSLVVWGGLYAVGLATRDEFARLLVEQFLWVGVATAPVAWIAFALEYTGHSRWLTRRTVGLLLVVPAISLGLVLTNGAHRLVWASAHVETVGGLSIVVQSYGPWFWVFAAYSYGLILLGAALILRLVFTAGTLYADQAAALVVGAVVPTVTNLASVLGHAPIEGLDLTPYAMAVAGLAFGYAIVRFRLFESVPATRHLGRDTVIDNMRDGVIILDESERIVDANAAARSAFAGHGDGLLGRSLAAILGDDVDVPDPDESREVRGARGNRTYEMAAAPIEDWQDRQVGTVLVLRDVTERSRREQRLSVLNRVLRHNLRNDANVVAGRADLLQEALDGQGIDHADRIRETAAGLVDMSEKARTIDRVIGGPERRETVDVVAVVEAEVARVRERFPDVAVEVTAPGSLTVDDSDQQLLEVLAANLLENAAEHNDAAEPRVAVTVAETDDGDAVRLTVADNGPSIPELEREVLDADTETDLAHGSGLGLWTINWCVRRLQGTLRFEDGEGRGNAVTVEVPASRPSASAVPDVEGEPDDAPAG